MAFKTARAMEMAVKEAAKASPIDTNKAIKNFYLDRLLCRVFSEEEPAFILKGGQSMLARTVDARVSRDIDLLYGKVDLDEALSELERLAMIDLGDFLEYRLGKVTPITAEMEYREGYNVSFIPVLGRTKELGSVSVDLVVDAAASAEGERVTSASRLKVGDLPVFDYLLYPLESTVVDKLCATMQAYPGGRRSSRVKDLVDLVIILSERSFDSVDMAKRLACELAVRRVAAEEAFAVPETWLTSLAPSYAKMAKEARVAQRFFASRDAAVVVERFANRLLEDDADPAIWNPTTLCWEEPSQQ